jgi:hypothetical protein
MAVSPNYVANSSLFDIIQFFLNVRAPTRVSFRSPQCRDHGTHFPCLNRLREQWLSSPNKVPALAVIKQLVNLRDSRVVLEVPTKRGCYGRGGCHTKPAF